MSRSQWRRFQRRRKAKREATEEPQPESSTNVPQRMDKGKQRKPLERKPIARRLEFPDQRESDEQGNSKSDATLDIMVNVVSVLPREYDRQVKVKETDREVEHEMAKHRPMCYYVMNNGCIKE